MAFKPILLATVLAVLLAAFTSADAACANSNETCNEQSNPHKCCKGFICKKPENPTVTDQPGRCMKCMAQDGSCGGRRVTPVICCDGFTCLGDAQMTDGPGLCKPTGSNCSAINTACRNDSILKCCNEFTCKRVDGASEGICK